MKAIHFVLGDIKKTSHICFDFFDVMFQYSNIPNLSETNREKIFNW